MDGPIQSDHLIGTSGFEHVRHLQLNEIKNFQNDFLTFCPEHPSVIFKSDMDPEVKEGTFYLDIYKELPGHKDGLPVAISYRIRHRNYIVCVENDSVTFKEGELPNIPPINSEFIFYKREYDSEDKTKDVTFESSVKRKFFLACSDDGQNLILEPPTGLEAFKILNHFGVTYSDVSADQMQTVNEHVPYHIRNSHDDFLIVQPEGSVATFDPNGDAKGERAMFYMNIYKELATNDGVPVIFSCKVDNRNYLLCVENNSVVIKESELPEEIPTETSKLIFYIKEFSSGHSAFRFESSLKFEPPLEQRFCLAWNKDDPAKKLTLKPFYEGRINESINFFIEAK